MKYIFPAYLPFIVFILFVQYLYLYLNVEGGEQLIILYHFVSVPRKWSYPPGILLRLHFIH